MVQVFDQFSRLPFSEISAYLMIYSNTAIEIGFEVPTQRTESTRHSNEWPNEPTVHADYNNLTCQPTHQTC